MDNVYGFKEVHLYGSTGLFSLAYTMEEPAHNFEIHIALDAEDEASAASEAARILSCSHEDLNVQWLGGDGNAMRR